MPDFIREEVNYEVFLAWISDRFPEYQESRGEVKINSIFTDDYKFHLWCNPEKNVFHCWKTNESGNLQYLVSKVDKCDIKTARSILGLGNRIRNLDAELEKFMAEAYPPTPVPPPPNTIKLPESTFLISELSDLSPSKKIASDYLKNRSIPVDGMYFCTNGKYRDRIIIPYYGPEGNIQYWNGRDITGKHNLKYWGPSRHEYKVGKEDVIYFYKYPPLGSPVILVEGEFDAASLTLSGLWGAAVSGKEISQKQIEILRMYQICLSFDNDKWWQKSLDKMGNKLLREGIELTFVCPPIGYKDWNNVLVDKGSEAIKKYIENNQRIFNQWTTFEK